jgi:hypothetical protein
MSHVTGTVQTLGTPLTIGPGSGSPPTSPNTWAVDFPYTEAPAPGTRLIMLHFQNVNLPGANRLEVELGYDLDVFTSADGASFWTRPIDNRAFPAGIVRVRYINTATTPAGSVQIDRYGRGERHAGEQDPTALSNCDPFLRDTVYTEPEYDPFWYCTEPPNWENVRKAPSADIRAKVAKSVGMIVTVHGSPPNETLSTCTVTLVDTDKVVSAGHCHNAAEAMTSSVVFGYETNAAGNRPSPYNPRFHKVAEALKTRNDSGFDYSLLRLKTSPAGIAPIQMRPDLPAVGEQVFGIHHPNGAVKKLSFPHASFATVTASTTQQVRVPVDFDVSGGSSGSGLFDTVGRIVGLLSRGNPCAGSQLVYFPTATMLTDIAPAPPPPITRDVMLVIDRSGSMSEDDGTGRHKIDAAKDAVSLFVQLVRSATGNRAGLVSFSTTAGAPTFAIAPVTDPNKTALIGGPPFAGGLVGSITPGGATSIGGGLDAARAQFPTPGANPRAILLLTDGLQNTPPFIASVEPSLAGIAVHAIGLGSDANLDSALLSALAAAHGGLYTRASSGLALLKFFSNAFGNIFEAGVLLDPEFDLPESQSGDPLEFTVCGEENLTIVVGWDRTDTSLVIQLQTPAGNIVNASTTGTENTFGRNWTYLRVPLPQGAERDGVWKVQVLRPEFEPIPLTATAAAAVGPALRYFVSVIPSGGPQLLRESDGDYIYTGDTISPLVRVRYADRDWPHEVEMQLTVRRPDAGLGNILSDAGLGDSVVIDGDVLPARQATLRAIEQSSGKPAIQYIEEQFTLQEDPANTRGSFEPAGSMGILLPDYLRTEGTYTFHARATYGECDGSRELVWTVHVDVGVDPGRTDVTIDPLGPQPGGSYCQRMTFTPRDKYGNRVGPGRAADLGISAAPGSSLSSSVHDLGDGSYQVDVCSEPGSTSPPGVVIAQPGRDPVVVGPGAHQLFRYSVNFLCGTQKKNDKDCLPVMPGTYATAISLHNLSEQHALVFKRVIPIALKGKVQGREPEVARVAAVDRVILPPHTATMDDCCRLQELLLGEEGDSNTPLTMGVLEIISTVDLAVTAIYSQGDDALHVQAVGPWGT